MPRTLTSAPANATLRIIATDDDENQSRIASSVSSIELAATPIVPTSYSFSVDLRPATRRKST
jgi:hypothetical protein